ncbi:MULTISPECIES: hypothetical protein [unclassified Streptomyces]|uniref:hypothetical protein n=1 Tax=unclassified Streptomyces TaxID=2593676 RepID=UPI002E266777
MLTDPAGKATSTEYRLDEGATQTATLASGKTTLTLTPTTRGTHTLTARVKSAADTWSDWAEYTFRTGNITGTLAVPFINKIAETHFADLLHPADGLEATDEPDEEIADEGDSPAGYVEQEDPEKTETEDSAVQTATTELPSSSVGTLTGQQRRRSRPDADRPPGGLLGDCRAERDRPGDLRQHPEGRGHHRRP